MEPADPYEGLTDEQVLTEAQTAYRKAEALPARSATRRIQWQIFDSAMGELTRRAMAHVLWKIHEREETALNSDQGGPGED